jgi:glycosyltransferase involved in cell wall biosynthesis
MHAPIVSIILPVYNAEKYIVECLESISTQSYPNWELIIVNDGSNDSSEKLIKVFIKNCKNDVQYFFTEHKGLPFCLNFGISHAQGRYIARMDADDIMCETRLAQQVNFMENKPEIGVLGTNFIEIDENGKELTIVKMPQGNELIKQKFFTVCAIAHPTVMARKEILIANKYLEKYPFPEDYELWTRLIETTNFENLQISLLKKRFHQDEITLSAGSGFIFDSLILIIAFNKKYRKKLPIYIILRYSLLMLATHRMRYLLRIKKLQYIKLIKLLFSY